MKVPLVERVLDEIILVVFTLFAIFPIITIIATALGPQLGDPSGGLHWENFAVAWDEGGFSQSLLRSALVAILVLPVALIVSIFAGYAFGTMTFPGSTVLFYVFLFGLMVPAEAIVIPLYYDFRALGLTDTIFAIALPQIAQSVAFGTFWMRTQFRAMPREVLEAAAIDGAGAQKTLWRILVPPAFPSVATVGVLMFMWTWNEFLIPLVMSPSGAWRTAPLALKIFKGQYTADAALMAAAGLVVAIPIVVVFTFTQKYFISGMLEGASKG